MPVLKKSGILLMFLVLLSGCGANVDISIRSFDLPDNLDSYLEKSEARFSDIRPDVEKKIVWADPDQKKQTKYSIVYLHGFSATRMETAPLADIIAQKMNANLYYARLNGHGRGADPMGQSTVNDWLNDGAEALEIGKQLGEKVIIVAASTGCTVVTWLATQEKFSKDIFALVFVSPNFFPKDSSARFVLWPGGGWLLRMIAGDYQSWEPRTEGQKKYWTTRYPINAIETMMDLVDIVDRIDLAAFQAPLLTIYSDKDQVIDPEKVKEKFNEIGSKTKKLIPFNTSQDAKHHVLAGDAVSPGTTVEISKLILNFLDTVPAN